MVALRVLFNLQSPVLLIPVNVSLDPRIFEHQLFVKTRRVRKRLARFLGKGRVEHLGIELASEL